MRPKAVEQTQTPQGGNRKCPHICGLLSGKSGSLGFVEIDSLSQTLEPETSEAYCKEAPDLPFKPGVCDFEAWVALFLVTPDMLGKASRIFVCRIVYAVIYLGIYPRYGCIHVCM